MLSVHDLQYCWETATKKMFCKFRFFLPAKVSFKRRQNTRIHSITSENSPRKKKLLFKYSFPKQKCQKVKTLFLLQHATERMRVVWFTIAYPYILCKYFALWLSQAEPISIKHSSSLIHLVDTISSPNVLDSVFYLQVDRKLNVINITQREKS